MLRSEALIKHKREQPEAQPYNGRNRVKGTPNQAFPQPVARCGDDPASSGGWRAGPRRYEGV